MVILESDEIGNVSNQSLDTFSYDEQKVEKSIEIKLVKEARNLLKEDWKKNGNEYSEKHYADLVDEKYPQTCWRYIIHREYNVEKAVELMKSALRWRKENRADECMNHELIKEFWFHSPLMIIESSKSSEDLFYNIGKHYRKPSALLKPHARAFVINAIFQWDNRNRNNLRKCRIIFDCTDCGPSNMDIDLMRWFFNMKDFIPARVGVIYVVGIPYIIRPFVRLIISWLPSQYRNLVKCCSFEELETQNIEPENLPPEVGGTAYDAYLAPIEAPWMIDVPSFMSDEMQKALKEALWFFVTEERWNQMRTQQVEFEAKAQTKKYT